MNTNYLLFLYANQKSFDIPSKVQSGLREKIKESDFLVTDDSGTHRLIGLRFYPETKNPPVITCVCMRHEMTAAKQIAFECENCELDLNNRAIKVFSEREGTGQAKIKVVGGTLDGSYYTINYEMTNNSNGSVL